MDAAEIIDVILFSYQGVRMFSTIMPLDEQDTAADYFPRQKSIAAIGGFMYGNCLSAFFT